MGNQSDANTPSRPSYQGASHHSKPQSSAEERQDPLPPSDDSWSPQDPGRPPHYPPKEPIPTQIRTNRLYMNDQFTSETKSLTGSHLSK